MGEALTEEALRAFAERSGGAATGGVDEVVGAVGAVGEGWVGAAHRDFSGGAAGGVASAC